jgi:3(or 17)beta-hydroxysteroid dehydrogenase
MLTKSIALWCAREQNGIRVNSVQPGTILTPNVESVIAGTPDPDATRAAFSVAQPIGRMGEVDDIAHLVIYLASDESKFATGAPFIVIGRSNGPHWSHAPSPDQDRLRGEKL